MVVMALQKVEVERAEAPTAEAMTEVAGVMEGEVGAGVLAEVVRAMEGALAVGTWELVVAAAAAVATRVEEAMVMDGWAVGTVAGSRVVAQTVGAEAVAAASLADCSAAATAAAKEEEQTAEDEVRVV